MITLAAPCAIGAEKVLANELRHLAFTPVGQAPGRVTFSPEKSSDGSVFSEMYRANLCLRTADRVYLQLASFHCETFDELFEGVKSIPWQDYFKKDVRVIVDKVRIHSSKLSSEHSVQGVAHKAIYDRLGAAWRMSILPETGDEMSVRIYIENNTAVILLDLSGKPLHRRGYRTAGGEAPIRETLAASLLQLMNWRRKQPLHDLFCGSGTIPIEAVLFAHNIAPGLGRSFSLENLAISDTDSIQKAIRAERTAAAEAIRTDCIVRVTGSDIAETVLVSARANAERACAIAGRALQDAGRDDRIPRPDFARASFEELAAPYTEGVIISNPPYGERLGDKEEALKLYESMRIISVNFPGWDLGFITSNEEFETFFGKKRLKSGN
ncbi:THUMP domain-containing class I SAM-dependent RNA methyltransferase [Brucepastera parasyntrophica]|uniref:THUMP domain-containing class I SAM-dependent RNA methyltransferase n=1 Tax=Brucepastera parasyntrophica TaxID=2880008 RepID=UPI0034E251DA